MTDRGKVLLADVSQVPIGPVPSNLLIGDVRWPYGAAMMPLPLPRLMQLAQSAAEEISQAGV